VLTYLHDAVDILPLLLITSPEENCGKTTLLKLALYLATGRFPPATLAPRPSLHHYDIAPTMTLDERTRIFRTTRKCAA
jgi:hypothetical protein